MVTVVAVVCGGGSDTLNPLLYNRRAQNPGMDVVLPQINVMEFPRWMSVAYTAVLEVSEGSVLFLSGLLHAERVRRGTRRGTRALGTYKQAVLVLRWFLDDTRMSALARDNNITVSAAYEYRDERSTPSRGSTS